MGKIIANLFLVVALIGCGATEETGFKSLEGETPDFQQVLESIVDDNIEKIGRRKGKKGQTVEVKVGGKDLQPLEKELERKTSVLEVVVYEEKPAPKEKVDILFYVGGETQNCLKGFTEEIKDEGFLSHLDALDWNVALSLFPKNPKIINLEDDGSKASDPPGDKWTDRLKFLKFKPVYVLKKSDREIDRSESLFFDTLMADDPSVSPKTYPSDNRYDPTRFFKVKNTLPVKDFIESLDDILSSSKGKFLREGSKLHIVVIDYDHFPYYTTKEWNNFYKKYPQMNIILLSSRRVNVSNFSHISESSKFNFEWLPKCNREGISKELLEALL